ncbi:MAG: NAD-dependent epimerase/dehydratase family protein [Fusobacteriaceae bacterium]
MKILITGSNGFIGKNLVCELNNRGYNNIFKITKETTDEEFLDFTENCDFVFHLAGVNRPENDSEFFEGNSNFTAKLLKRFQDINKFPPVLISSSIQAELENSYGKSKKMAEEIILDYSKKNKVKTYIYRLPNAFGKWCKPNYNSAVATFCNNIANNMEIKINNADANISLVYIDDVIHEFINALERKENTENKENNFFYKINPVYNISVGKIAELIYSFKESRENLIIPNLGDDFTKKLYSTYLSYLSKNNFRYPLKMNIDNRGSFTEFLKTSDKGQVSINISKPGITKGNHWHHSKNEKFLVVSGKGVIKFRNIITNEIIEYFVSSEKLEVIDIPTGHTHNITNLGDTEMVTVMWVNEIFDPNNPDTYFLEV